MQLKISAEKLVLAAVLFSILLLGFYFRTLVGLNWDEDQHLHPDERFLTMVTEAIEFPDSIGKYFDSASSPLSPYNKNYSFFVYGTLPIFITKALAAPFNMDNYGGVHLVGRVVSALFDLATIFLLYLAGAKLYSKSVGILAALLLSLSVLHIQMSHFYGVEVQAAFFILLVFYLSLEARIPRYDPVQGPVTMVERYLNLPLRYLLMGLFFGLALASKVSTVFFGVLLGVAALLDAILFCKELEKQSGLSFRVVVGAISWQAVLGVIGFIGAILAFRIFQPYAFGGNTFLNFEFSEKFLANMREIKGMMGGADYPPSIQWVDRTPLFFSLKNMILWHLGIFLGVTVCLAVAYCLYELIKKRKFQHFFLLFWGCFWFIYQSTAFVMPGRYLVSAYPFLLLLAAYFLIEIGKLIQTGLLNRTRMRTGSNYLLYAPAGIVVLMTLLWAVAFTNIYRRPVSRVEASRWIYSNIPCGTTLANEHWDDGMPLRIDGKDGFGGCYKGLEFNHYWPDDQKKLNETLDKLQQTEYIILSSNRLYLSIPRLPRRFPFTIKYYEMLFSGELGFELVKTFSSYPSIFGVEFNDDFAEESFTVYDHPKVLIFKKTSKFDIEKVRSILSSFPAGVIEPLV